MWRMFLLVAIGAPLFGNGLSPRTEGNHPKVEVVKPVVIQILDATDIITVFTTTKQLTDVYLPLTGSERIEEIRKSDDERIWQTLGKGTQVLSIKPSNLAYKSSLTVRTTAGVLYHLELLNIDVPALELLDLSEREKNDMEAVRNRFKGKSGYRTVVVRYRDGQILSEHARIAQLEEQLESEVTKYRELNEALRVEQAGLEKKFQEKLITESRSYAKLIDFRYRVHYQGSRKERKAKREAFPVLKVFSDGVFTWVQLAPEAPALHIYEVGNDGFQVVNYTNPGDNLYRIDRMVSTLEFRDTPKGDWVFRIERN